MSDAGAPASHRAGRRYLRAVAVLLAILVPVCVGVFLYLERGNPVAIAMQQAGPAGSNSQQQAQASADALKQRVIKNPSDGRAWASLARTYVSLGRLQEARAAYATAESLLPPDAQLLAEYADVLALLQGKRLQGEPEERIRRALEADPKNVKALALSGSLAFEKQEFTAAVGLWQQMLALIPPESDLARRAAGSIKKAQGLAAEGSVTPKGRTGREASSGVRQATAPQRKVEQSAGAAGGVGVLIKLAPEMAARFTPQDTLFLFAMPAEGSNHPLAIMRRQAAGFPVRYTLDDSMAVMPNARLSGAEQFVVGAHISRSGVASPRSGDLQGFSTIVKKGTKAVVVLIDREVH